MIIRRIKESYCQIVFAYTGILRDIDIEFLEHFNYFEKRPIYIQMYITDKAVPLFLLNGFSIDLILREQIRIGAKYYSAISLSYSNSLSSKKEGKFEDLEGEKSC